MVIFLKNKPRKKWTANKSQEDWGTELNPALDLDSVAFSASQATNTRGLVVSGPVPRPAAPAPAPPPLSPRLRTRITTAAAAAPSSRAASRTKAVITAKEVVFTFRCTLSSLLLLDDDEENDEKADWQAVKEVAENSAQTNLHINNNKSWNKEFHFAWYTSYWRCWDNETQQISTVRSFWWLDYSSLRRQEDSPRTTEAQNRGRLLLWAEGGRSSLTNLLLRK